MSVPPVAVYSAAQVRAMDRHAIEHLGIPGYTLMTRAGEAALGLLVESWPRARRLLVACGGGNNGGDGYVLARLARDAGHEVLVAALAEPARLTGDAARAHADFVAGGGQAVGFDPAATGDADVIVDALFGTGLGRPVEGSYRDCIEALNASQRPILALDLPSGLHADTGAVMGVAVRATRTLTFVGLKTGLYLGAGPDCVGSVDFAGLGLPAEVASGSTAVLERITANDVALALPRRRRGAHKGEHGRVLLIGGAPGMPGAVRLAAEAALRAGAGLVTVATHGSHAAAIAGGRPEIICHGVDAAVEARPLMAAADVIAIGPGLGQSDWSRGLLEAALAAGKPLIVDADALNLLARSPWRSDHWVLTPHPGEAARLLGSDASAVQGDRLAAARSLVERFGGTAVLKGAATLVATAGQPVRVCDRGNPGMASAGMGDVLTGAIAGIAAQCRDLPLAARVGVYVHALAGDLAARRGERGLMAGDLIDELRACVNRD